MAIPATIPMLAPLERPDRCGVSEGEALGCICVAELNPVAVEAVDVDVGVWVVGTLLVIVAAAVGVPGATGAQPGAQEMVPPAFAGRDALAGMADSSVKATGREVSGQ
jgi:hypothetical protein